MLQKIVAVVKKSCSVYGRYREFTEFFFSYADSDKLIIGCGFGCGSVLMMISLGWHGSVKQSSRHIYGIIRFLNC